MSDITIIFLDFYVLFKNLNVCVYMYALSSEPSINLKFMYKINKNL